jgi:hypothetical protein
MKKISEGLTNFHNPLITDIYRSNNSQYKSCTNTVYEHTDPRFFAFILWNMENFYIKVNVAYKLKFYKNILVLTAELDIFYKS